METMYFGSGDVGFKLHTLQDVVKAQALGLAVCNEEGCFFDYSVMGEDEDGEQMERQPTQDEVFERLQSAMQDGQVLYAAFNLDCGCVVPFAKTSLQSSFSVGQKAIMMHDNQPIEVEIAEIWLYSGDGKAWRDEDWMARNIETEITKCFNDSSSKYINKPTHEYVVNVLKDAFVRRTNMAFVEKKEDKLYLYVELENLYHSTEELFKHLQHALK